MMGYNMTSTDAATPKTFTEYAQQVLNFIRTENNTCDITYDAAANHIKENYDEISKIRSKQCTRPFYMP